MPSSRGASFRHAEAERALSGRARRWLGTTAALALGLSLAPGAAAQAIASGSGGAASGAPSVSDEPARVILLVRTVNDDGVMNRVRAELGASAWRILELRLDERLGRVPLSELAAQQQARAAVRFNAAEARVELWVFRPPRDLEETLDAADERDDDAVVALRISEALRARGLDLGAEAKLSAEAKDPAEGEGQGEAKGPEASREAAKPSPRPEQAAKAAAAREVTGPGEVREQDRSGHELWLELAGAVSGSPGELGAAIGAWGGARLALGPRWACSLFGVIPLSSQQLSGVEGSARVASYLLGASTEAAWLRRPRWQLGAGVGLAGSRTEMEGTAASGYVGSGDAVYALSPLARVTARVQLAEGVWLSAGGLAGLAFPEVSVKFADRVAAHWGRPLLLATLGLELRTLRFSGSEGASESP